MCIFRLFVTKGREQHAKITVLETALLGLTCSGSGQLPQSLSYISAHALSPLSH